MLYPNEFVIDDDTPNDLLFNFKVDGVPVALGCEPRDYGVSPVEMFAPPSDIPMIPRSQWSDRIKEMEANKSRTSDVMRRAKIPCQYQNGDGYCWSYSTTGAVKALRALNGQAFIDLNPHSVAAIIKKGANVGGWAALSAEFLEKNGVADTKRWPKLSRDYRRYDTPETRANMALHKVTETFVDLTRNVYDRNLNFEQMMSCLLQNIPVAIDLMWWRHSVVAVDPVEIEPGSFGPRIWNSHGPTYGDDGYAVMRGSKGIPDGAIAIRATTASKE